MGSKRDFPFAKRVGDFLAEEGFSLKCEYNVASAHKTPEFLVKKVEGYEGSGDSLVYITIAGLSDALSGVIAGTSRHPVIACPPDLERYGWSKVFSSVMTPLGIPVMFVSTPENAALAALRILALTDVSLSREMERFQAKKRDEVIAADEDISGEG
ncbi:MAG: AIR carboxylase family protein [Candidatus Bathyarchaeia archaeon]